MSVLDKESKTLVYNEIEWVERKVAIKEIERLEKENERYCIVINEMAITISKAIEYIERYMFSQKENYDYIHLLGILKGR